MANIYYPKNSVILQRTTSGSAFTEVVIDVVPDVIFYFSGSNLQGFSASYLSVTSSWAENVISSSYSQTASIALNVPTPTASISSSYATTASYALTSQIITSSISASYSTTSSFTITASYALNAVGSPSVSSSWASSSLSSSYALISNRAYIADKAPITTSIYTIEALESSSLVNIFYTGSSYFARAADFSNINKEATGYVTESYSSGSLATVHFSGIITGLSGLNSGDQYLSSSGKPSGSYPTSTGYFVQYIGKALTSTSIEFSPSVPIGLSTTSTSSLSPTFTSASYSLSSSYSISDFIRVDASEFNPRLTNGCGTSSVETITNFINRDFLTFDPVSIEYAQYWFNWPAGWNSAKITFYWTATADSGSAVLFAGMRTFENASSQNGAFGIYQGIASTYTGSNICIVSTTDPVIPSGSINAWQRTVLQIYRDPTNPSDNLTTDLLLEGVSIHRAS